MSSVKSVAERDTFVVQDLCVHRMPHGQSRGSGMLDLPDMVASRPSSSHLGMTTGADSSGACCCNHEHRPHRRRSQNQSRRQSAGSRDVSRGRRSTSPYGTSSCCCSDSGSAVAPFDRAANWRASMTSSPDSLGGPMAIATNGETDKVGSPKYLEL